MYQTTLYYGTYNLLSLVFEQAKNFTEDRIVTSLHLFVTFSTHISKKINLQGPYMWTPLKPAASLFVVPCTDLLLCRRSCSLAADSINKPRYCVSSDWQKTGHDGSN